MEFSTWLKEVQAMDASTFTPEQLAFWESMHRDAMARGEAWRAQRAPARSLRSKDRRCAIAIEDDTGLGLTFWIKRSAKGEVFLMYPREPDFDPHTSYHLDGTCHSKSYGAANFARKRQPLGPNFKGTEHLGMFAGHGAGPRIEDPESFDHILIAPPGSLTGRSGSVFVDLVEPGQQPASHHLEGRHVVAQVVHDDDAPWIVVSIVAG